MTTFQVNGEGKYFVIIGKQCLGVDYKSMKVYLLSLTSSMRDSRAPLHSSLQCSYLFRFVVFSLPFQQLCLVYLVYIVLFRPLVYFGSICFGENIQAQTQFSPWISSYCSRCSIVHIIVINITMCVHQSTVQHSFHISITF